MSSKNAKKPLTIWWFVGLWFCLVIFNSGMDAIKSPPSSFEAFLPVIGAHMVGHFLGILFVWFLYHWWINRKPQM
jgi:hypothetical protein